MAQDPQWKRFAGGPHSSLVGLGRDNNPTLGVGGFVCDGCGEPHVLVAAIIYDLETGIYLEPRRAREVAAALLEAANRVDAGGVS